jgi:galactose oxidase
MFWFSTDGEGSALVAGTRPGGDIANGNSVMFDKGKIMNCGGSEAFAIADYPATTFASLITINEVNVQVTVKELPPMNLPRVYANAVVLPDGKVLITGGASHPKEFSDEYAHFQPGVKLPPPCYVHMQHDCHGCIFSMVCCAVAQCYHEIMVWRIV